MSIYRVRYVLIAVACMFVVYGCGGSDVSTSTVDTNPITCGDSSNVYVRTDGSDNNPGTITLPLQTIQAAVECGQSGQAIRVANGTYQTSSSSGVGIIRIQKEGQSLYGGYSSDFQVHSPLEYETIITDTTDSSFEGTACAVEVVLTDPVSANVIYGFTINGPSLLKQGIYKVICVSGGSPIVNNNVIDAGVVLGHEVVGIDVSDGSPVIVNNTIDGGINDYASWGVRAYSQTPITVSNNTINGGEAPYYDAVSGSHTGIQLDISTSGSVVSGNTINGGAGYTTNGIVLVGQGSVVIESNTITSGFSEANLSIGIVARGDMPIIRNNTIILTGWTSVGIKNLTNSWVNSNTIVGGGLNSTTGVNLDLVEASGFQNNIIELNDGTCFYMAPSSRARLGLLNNNNLYGCEYLYSKVNVYTSIDDINSILGDNNISMPSVLDDTQDYRLTASSPIEVTEGGRDLSSEFSVDKLGMPRTPPWSIGAYEYD